LPYHFYRGQLHLFLDNYALIPPIVLIAVQLATGVSFDGDPAATRRRRFALLIVAATVCTGVYYGFFGAFIILIGGLLGAAAKRSWEPAKSAGLLAMAAALVLMLNVAPTMWYVFQNGKNADVAARSPIEAEVFALRLTYLLLPYDGHRVAALSAITRAYDQQVSDELRAITDNPAGPPTTQSTAATRPFNLESRSESLGILASAGFLVLLAVLLLNAAGIPQPKIHPPPQEPVSLLALASLNLACILLAATGAVGSLIAAFVSPLIRSYDRICVVIAFLSFAAVAMLIDRCVLKPLASRGRGAVGLLILAALLVLATLDQVPRPLGSADRRQQLADFHRDDDFVKRIEQSVPAGSMIFQLPHVGFPEAGSVGRIQDYDPFRGYIHSTTLRWSYGTIRGRQQDKTDDDLASLPPNLMVPRLRTLGFAGIWVDLFGYDSAQWTTIQSSIASATGSSPVTSNDPDRRFLFFNIRP
jgi:phosphoglycerol transferase